MDSEEQAIEPLYVGDTGDLCLESRRALIQLLQGPALDARYHGRLWQALLQDEENIRRYLSALFLELIIDASSQIAFVRQSDTQELEAPRMLKSLPLNFEASVLLLFLRQQLIQAQAQGRRAVVSENEIVEYFMAFERSGNTDRALFLRRIQAAIEKMKKPNILQKIRNSEGRFEISSVLKLLFSAEEVQELTRQYRHIAAHQAPVFEAQEDADE